MQLPSLETELSLGLEGLVGVDEVGRGCIAGPVVVASCMVDYDCFISLDPKQRALIRDSKKLSPLQRIKAEDLLRSSQLLKDYKIVERSAQSIDLDGIQKSIWDAMLESICTLRQQVCHVLVDGNAKIPSCPYPQTTVVQGDLKVVAIACASILAKTYRDRWMASQDDAYPQYGFSSHVGYGTQKHVEAIREYGSCSLHRRSFEPIKSLCHSQ